MPTDETHQMVPAKGSVNINWQMVAITIALTFNVGTMVWQASSLAQNFAILKESFIDLKSTTNAAGLQQNNNAVRLGVLESKVDDLRDQLNEARLARENRK